MIKNGELSIVKKRDVSNRTMEAIKQRKDRKKQRIKVGFELNAKLKNRTKSSANLRGFEKLQNVRFVSNTSGMVGIRVDVTNIACPPGYVQRKMRCGTCLYRKYLFLDLLLGCGIYSWLQCNVRRGHSIIPRGRSVRAVHWGTTTIKLRRLAVRYVR